MTRVADLIFGRLADAGLSRCFLVTGGGAMFLNDALRREPRIAWTCTHHEQAAAMAAEGYARVASRPAILSVSSGPGGINALNGVYGAWTDSIPMVVVSGQVKRETCVASYPGLGLRQLGDQEADIVSLAQQVTKYAARVTKPQEVAYHVDRALYLATHGRPGPVWLDVPIDVQSTDVDEARLVPYEPGDDRLPTDTAALTGHVTTVYDRLARAARPVVLVGTGVRLAGGVEVLRRVMRRLGIPVTSAWTHDLVASNDPLWCGRQGTIGDRAGNFAVQNADALLVIGSRLAIRQVSYNWGSFAPQAFKIQVDVDPHELRKPTVRPDLAVVADARLFLEGLEAEIERRGWDVRRHAAWLAWCRERVRRYPVVQVRHRTSVPPINPYHFLEILFAHLASRDVVVTGNGAACVMTFQTARLAEGQRLFSNSGSASMGYDLPAALGAAAALAEVPGEGAGRGDAVARGRQPRVVCLAGDGSLQMNVQELQTLATARWQVKLFVLDNGGYLSIRTTQNNFFGGRIGEGPSTGVEFPDWVALAHAYGIDAVRIEHPGAMSEEIVAALATPGPCLAHVVLDPEQGFEPRVKSRELPDGTIESPALDDLYPFLSRDELAANRVAADGTLP